MHTNTKSRVGRLVISLFPLMVFTLIISLGPAGESIGAGRKMGGRLVFGAENDFVGFDTIKARGLPIIDAIANSTIHERLFGLDSGNNLVPILGLSASPSADRKTWTIKLREGVRFHDNTPFNADAVVQHWRRLLDPENHYRGLALIEPVKAVQKIDEYTVAFILHHEWLPFPQILAEARGLGSFIPSPKAVEEDSQLRFPVGTGPFMFKEWRSGDSFTVRKNPYYWQKGKPYLDEITFKMIPDHQARFASLQAGQLDMTWMDRGNILQKSANDAGIVHYQSTGNGAEIFVLNTRQPPLDDPKIRRALAHAWNQQACVDISYHNAIPFISHPFGETIQCGEVDYPEFAPAKAEELLAGRAEFGSIECLHTNTKRGQEQGVLFRQFGKNAGFSINPAGLSFGPIIKRVFTGDYQISTWRLPSRLDMGAGLYTSFHSGSATNLTGYSNPKMDALLEAQRVETNSEKRQAILCRIAKLINQDVPIIYRGGQGYHILAGSHVKGLEDFRNGVAQLADIWLDR